MISRAEPIIETAFPLCTATEICCNKKVRDFGSNVCTWIRLPKSLIKSIATGPIKPKVSATILIGIKWWDLVLSTDIGHVSSFQLHNYINIKYTDIHRSVCNA